MAARAKRRSLGSDGFSLIEVIVVISIMGVLTVIAVPVFGNYTESARKRVCEINRFELERQYEVYLGVEGSAHSGLILEAYLVQEQINVCPAGGGISYVDGAIRCSEHFGESVEDGEDVPYL